MIVKTANVWLAGTDAFLYLQLIGSNKMRSGESKVGTEDGSHDDFEKGVVITVPYKFLAFGKALSFAVCLVSYVKFLS